jgi:hypothetical protein
MAQIVKIKRSSVAGSKPTTESLEYGELAINYEDGKVFFRKNDDSIQTILATNTSDAIEGNVLISGSIGILSGSGHFSGSGRFLTDLTVAQTATVKAEFTNSDTWSLEHRLDTENPIAAVYDSNNYQIIPQTLQIIDRDNIEITFESAQSGYAIVAQGGHIVSGSIEAENIVGFDARVKTKLDAEGVFSSSAQVIMGGDITGTAANASIGEIDGGGI